ncbi:Uncharacterized conserved protein, DUF362 family [Tindallia magadiensis]|uniref:Uncharacterized conserved protein, DUF362 family n=1 Tax=Tindallia magadiensis TaxID=69895 RepID=A0A1I3DTJ0_9FIRM|nr:DUF362 domain-containing protein [Tindallia magadiensis]SFH89869.1 Uncharacterized conserved protein, DUF362 family [Tindallia magadiensis]
MKINEILIHHGDDMKEMAKRLLKYSKVEKEIGKDFHVGIKPNLVEAKPASTGATTHVELVETVVDFLKEIGIQKITIMEGSWVGDSTEDAFLVCGYKKLAQEKGVELIDLKTDSYETKKSHEGDLEVCKAPLKVDYLINMPVMKGHCQTGITCALKNMKGCIPDFEKRRYHQMGLHGPIAAVNTILKPDLILVDAMNGDLTYEGGGTPVPMDRIFLAKDPVLTDAWAAKTMGWSLDEIPYIRIAEKLGVGSSNIRDAVISEFGKATRKIDPTTLRGEAKDYGEFVDEGDACSACYATLLYALKRLDEEGKLVTIVENIKIGQGYKGLSFPGIGIGDCTSGCSKSLSGCPPEAGAILKFLKNEDPKAASEEE